MRGDPLFYSGLVPLHREGLCFLYLGRKFKSHRRRIFLLDLGRAMSTNFNISEGVRRRNAVLRDRN